MREVTAYEDTDGRLHKTQLEAIYSDFNIRMVGVGNTIGVPNDGWSWAAGALIKNTVARQNLAEAIRILQEETTAFVEAELRKDDAATGGTK